MKKYVLYGASFEAERFLYYNKTILSEVAYCIDRSRKGTFHDIPIRTIEEATDIKKYFVIVTTIWDFFREIKAELEKRNMREFQDFIWGRLYGKKLVVINANCYKNALEAYLQANDKFRQKYALYPLPTIYENIEKELGDDLLKRCDVYIHQDIRKENKYGYKFSDEYTVPLLKEDCLNIVMPNLVGIAGWLFPQQMTEQYRYNTGKEELRLIYKNSVLEEAYSLHKFTTVSEYEKFYNEKKYDENVMQKNFEDAIAKLLEREKNWDVKVSGFILDNLKRVKCFVDADHPSEALMKVIEEAIAEMLGVGALNADSKFECQLGSTVPMLPCIREYFKMDFKDKGEYPRSVWGDEEFRTLQEYIKHYLWVFYEVDLTE